MINWLWIWYKIILAIMHSVRISLYASCCNFKRALCGWNEGLYQNRFAHSVPLVKGDILYMSLFLAPIVPECFHSWACFTEWRTEIEKMFWEIFIVSVSKCKAFCENIGYQKKRFTSQSYIFCPLWLMSFYLTWTRWCRWRLVWINRRWKWLVFSSTSSTLLFLWLLGGKILLFLQPLC